MSEVELEPEFQLLVRCCQWNFGNVELSARPEIPADCDWSRIERLARRHRVQGLVWNALADGADRMPANVKQTLSTNARSIAATNLGIAAECRELRQDFEQAQVPLLFIKGLTVGALAYSSPMLKMGWDIDLLVDPGDLAAAAGLLAERGYSLQLPGQISQLRAWHGWSKESVWARDGSIHVELHTRLADNQHLIPGIDVNSPRQLVQVAPNVSLPTLAEKELITYLAVHGASSAWFRLKWISDFAALLAGRSGGEIGQLYRASQLLGAARAASQALLLADRLFDVLQPIPELRDKLASDRATQLLCRAALRIMNSGTLEPTERPLGTLAIHWTQFLLRPAIDFKLSELRRQSRGLFRR